MTETERDEPRAKPRKRARVVRLLAALSIGAIVAAVAGELVCRARWGAPIAEREPLMEVVAHPTRGYAMRPGTTHYTYLEEVRVNALGLRGRGPEDVEGASVRVLCVGDSMVYGQGVAEDATVPRSLERALARRSPSVDVRAWNGGLRAYNTQQEVALLEEMLPALRPHVVVLFWFANDLEDVDVEAMSKRLERSGPIVFDVGGPMTDDARSAWRTKQLLRKSAFVMKLHDMWTDLTWKPLSPASSEAGWTRLDESLARVAELAREHPFDVLVAVIPPATQIPRKDDARSAAPRVVAACAAHGIAAIDLLPVLRAQWSADRRLHVLAYDGHYDGTANTAMAEQVADELEERFARRFGGG